MWNDEEEINEKGESVSLYLPGQGPIRKISTDMVDSHIGGLANGCDAPKCGVCGEDMFLLSQVCFPKIEKQDGSKVDRSVSVFACPITKCCESIKYDKGFSSEGNSVMSCRVLETPVDTTTKPKPAVPVAPIKSSWYSKDADEDNEWDVKDDDIMDADQLEDAVAAMEKRFESGEMEKTTKKDKPAPSQPPAASSTTTNTSFPCYMLTKRTEPLAQIKPVEADDVGLSASDDKIRNMLARYMAEEEDEEILAALQGTAMGGGGGGEEDERLSEEERLLLGFQDRLRRAPRQVIRYAPGGVPLWSIPSTKKKKTLWKTPVCTTCGKECSFEMQLLPSLLHILEVDRYTTGEKKTNNDGNIGLNALISNGMNWGSVAVFTCQEEDCPCSEGSLVVQESVDENPEVSEVAGNRDMTPTMAVVEDMDDDADFEPYGN